MNRTSKSYIFGLVLTACAASVSAEEAAVAAACAEPPAVRATAAPAYTDLGLDARVVGVVLVRVTLDDAGRVQDATVVKKLPLGLDEVSRAAALRWEFAPPSPSNPCRTADLAFQFVLVAKAEGGAPLGVVTLPGSVKVIGISG